MAQEQPQNPGNLMDVEGQEQKQEPATGVQDKAAEFQEQMHDLSTYGDAQQRKPMTYGDVFNVAGDVANEPITPEDSALMQSAEALAYGQTQKGGAASIMQSAADYNVKTGAISPDAHSSVADVGVTVRETRIPGMSVETEYVGDAPVAGMARPMPTTPEIAASDAVTIGEALEAASIGAIDQPIEQGDASAIQSAESRATGIPVSVKGGLAATAQSAAELNQRVNEDSKTTLGDVLADATTELLSDKVVTMEDAAKVAEAEARHSPTGMPRPGGISAAMKAAAELNERTGLVV